VIEVLIPIVVFVEVVKERSQVSILPFIIAIHGSEVADDQFPHDFPSLISK
jgi:hypothetical protein